LRLSRPSADGVSIPHSPTDTNGTSASTLSRACQKPRLTSCARPALDGYATGTLIAPCCSPDVHRRRIFADSKAKAEPQVAKADAATTPKVSSVALSNQMKALEVALRCGALTQEQYSQALDGVRHRAK
jgi:hypothetical protein